MSIQFSNDNISYLFCIKQIQFLPIVTITVYLSLNCYGNSDHIYEEKMSGKIKERPILDNALTFMRNGDTLVVWKLDRLGRSLRHLIEVINQLMDSGMYFMSLQEKIDTTSTSGKLIFHIFAVLVEFEREIISERTKAGLKAARARGRFGGRPKKLNEEQTQMVKKMWKDHTIAIDEICRTFDISKTAMYRYLKE